MSEDRPLERGGSLREQSIPERFEEIVVRNPNRLAVKFAGRSLSYRELNEASNRIARTLLAVTHSDSAPVSILFDHGTSIIAAIIGALKAGKRVCTLDTHAPEERLMYILDNCKSSLIVTNSKFLNVAQRLARSVRTVVDIDEIQDWVSSSNPDLPILPSQTAIIAYTSGSTGQPRGVARTHRERVARAISSSNSRKLYAEDRLSLLHSISFGSGAADLFLALLNGAAILPFDIAAEGVVRLVEWLKEERITIFHAPPAAFRELARLEFPHDYFTDLRLIRLSGAPITQRDFELYRSKFDRRTLLEIGMGSTEIEAICNAVVTQDFLFPPEGSPIGYTRQGKEVLILSDEGYELGPAEVGEIAVRSRDFTPDYWLRQGLSEDKFRRDPKDADAWIYLTGDFGTRSDDGFVIHRGRKDLMVKIRGYRVNIIEIESVLCQHPVVQDAGAVAWDRESGEKYLAAYVVLRTTPAPRIDELRAFLSNSLPDFMIPSAFVFLESLPLTNGKLDRKALPKPEGNRPEISQSYIVPQSKVNQELVRIWEEVLDVRPIGIHDNFFDLGGHSLAASRVISQLIQIFQLELPIKALFESPTIAKMAAIIEQNRPKPASDPELAQMLCEIEAMTEEEVRKQLTGESTRSSRKDRHA